MARDDGGPAFPTESEHQASPVTMKFEGMSLRDYFAGQALAGLFMELPNRDEPEHIAEHCYEVADAMLSARGGADNG